MNPKFIGKVKLNSQGQITLPTEARRDLSIDIGDELYWYELNDTLIIVKELVNQKDIIKKIIKKEDK